MRASWGSRLGFVLAVAGSAVGLANIWRFPYLVGAHGGAAFIALYLLCLLLIGFPVFIAEIVIGRKTKTSPAGAFAELGKRPFWRKIGTMTILTGLLVSSFYSAIAGWILGYLIEAFKGELSSFQHLSEVAAHHEQLMTNPFWGVSFHFIFLAFCIGVLFLGVRGGIERFNKIVMPTLFVVLIVLVIKGLSMDGAAQGLHFLLFPDWSRIDAQAVLMALGQAFFTLSVGQGTMVTYGSYVNSKENLLRSGLPVVAVDTTISLLSAIAVFTIVFSAGLEPNSGPGLIFQTLPWVFSHTPAGHLLAILFFLLVLLAALTSEISALEPSIAYLVDERGWKRSSAVLACGTFAFIVGIPCALSTSLLSDWTLRGGTFLDSLSYLASAILIPLGGLGAVILVGWIWGTPSAIAELESGAENDFKKMPWLATYFRFCFKYIAPILMIIVFISALGLLG